MKISACLCLLLSQACAVSSLRLSGATYYTALCPAWPDSPMDLQGRLSAAGSVGPEIGRRDETESLETPRRDEDHGPSGDSPDHTEASSRVQDLGVATSGCRSESLRQCRTLLPDVGCVSATDVTAGRDRQPADLTSARQCSPCGAACQDPADNLTRVGEGALAITWSGDHGPGLQSGSASRGGGGWQEPLQPMGTKGFDGDRIAEGAGGARRQLLNLSPNHTSQRQQRRAGTGGLTASEPESSHRGARCSVMSDGGGCSVSTETPPVVPAARIADKPVEPTPFHSSDPGSIPGVSNTYSLSDAFAMASTIYAEARGEPEPGQIGVAHVILRRARARGVSIERVVLAPRQFSCWDGGRRMPRDRHARRAFARALRIADGVLSGALEDPTGGADHFHAVGVSPSWAVGMRPHGVIGGHAFLGSMA